jgi:hypothetical protein
VPGLPVPGQEFGDTSGRMIGDAGEHVGDIVLRVETVELGGLDQGIDCRGAAAARLPGSFLTPRWREMDSNFRFRAR